MVTTSRDFELIAFCKQSILNCAQTLYSKAFVKKHTRLWVGFAILGCHFLVSFLVPNSLAVSEVPFSKSGYSRFVQDEQVADVLRSFAATQGVRIVVSDKVQGLVSGDFRNVAPSTFFDQMIRVYGLIWFYDGYTLYVSDGSEAVSQMMQVGDVDIERIANTLDNFGVSYSSAALRSAGTEGLIYVTGEPRLVSLVQDIAKNLTSIAIQTATITQQQPDIEVFPLKYAWAYDTSFASRTSQVTVPGVATTLQNLLGAPAAKAGQNGSLSMSGGSPAVQQNRAAMTGLLGKGLASQGTNSTSGASSAPGASTMPSTAANTSPSTMQGDGSNPPGAPNGGDRIVQADPRRNAVIVKDVKSRISLYRKVIEMLDVPVAVIEIKAAIIDVNTTLTRNLGTDFFLSQRIGKSYFQFGTNSPSNLVGTTATTGTTNSALSSLPVIARDAVSGAGGLTTGGIVSESATQFLSRIQALEQRNYAKVQARPSVLTLDNVEADIRNDDTIYIPVGGYSAVDLFNINAGLELKVTPHVIRNRTTTMIKLLLDISDGGIDTGTTVTSSNIPTVHQSTITTQAVLHEGQSLLVGGYSQDTNNNNTQGIPVLNRIPILGYLFKTVTKAHQRTERIFLVTPRIVSLGYSTAPADGKDVVETPQLRADGLIAEPSILKATPVIPR